ncbi:MAG: hypothetical protein HYV60_24220, partial [Planctomycetia bacterium]|nr:hypothetical protein [Planctomycetia bacterium]
LKQLPKYDKLQELVLQECRSLTDDGLSNIGENRHLAVLKLIRVPVSDKALAGLKSSKTLEELLLAHTRVGGSGLRDLVGTPIAKLAIHGPGLKASGLAALAELTALRELELQCPDILFQDLPSLSSLENLESIICPKTQLGPAGLDRLRGHPRVSRLLLNSSEINDKSVDVLNTMAALADLELSNATITDAGLARLALPRLQRLCLGGCAGVTDAALSQLDQLQSLEVLDLQATAVTGQELSGLGAIRTLRTVLMSGEQFKGNQQTLSAFKKLLPQCKVVIMRG